MASLIALLGTLALLALIAACALFGGSAFLEGCWWREVATHVDGQLRGLGLHWDRRDAWRGVWRGRTVAARLQPSEGGVRLRLYMQVPTEHLEVVLRHHRRSGLPRDSVALPFPWALAFATGPSGPRLGDREFDERWLVRGTVAERAYLTAPIRHSLSRASGCVEIRNGWLVLEEGAPTELSYVELSGRLHELASLSDAFWEGVRCPTRRIEDQVLREPVAGVRWRALAALTRERPYLARRLAFRALLDGNSEVRGVAARVARVGGALAALALDESVALPVRRAAARDLLALPDPERQLVVAEGLQAHPDAVLERFSARLAASVGPAGEPILLAHLERGTGPVLRAAVHGLSRTGGVRALRPLRRLMARSARLGTLYPEVRAAVDVLVARCAVRAGGLALVHGGGRAGDVALATPTPAGSLSLAAGPSDVVAAHS